MTLYVFFSFVAFLLYVQAALHFVRVMPKSKVNSLFELKLLALAWVSLVIFLSHLTNQTHTVYLLDRFGVFGWIAFPILISSFFYTISNRKDKRIELIIKLFLLPVALAILARYQYHPESLKFYYQGESGIWYFETNIDSFWTKLSVVYLSTNTAIVLTSFWRWMKNIRQSIYKKDRIKAIVIFISLLLFVIMSLGSHIVLPMIGGQSIPAMIHISAIPLMTGIFITSVILHPKTHYYEMISDIFMERMKDFVFHIDHNGRIYSVNQHVIDTLGYSVSELNNSELTTFFKPTSIINKELKSIEKQDNESIVICFLVPKNAKPIPVSIFTRKVYGAFGNITGLLIVASDYSKTNALLKEYKGIARVQNQIQELNAELEEKIRIQRNGLQEAGRKLLDEEKKQKLLQEKAIKELRSKEKLLHEIQHRVKNNIQTIVSLINLEQNRSHVSFPVKTALSSISGRIRDISVIQDYLYDSPYMGKIKFSQYIKRMIVELKGRYPLKSVFFNVSLSEDKLTIDQAMPCGIIVYELIDNAIKFAFERHNNQDAEMQIHADEAYVQVMFYSEAGHFYLVVKDNGVGIQLLNGQPVKKNIGLNLVDALVKDDLGGYLKYFSENGTTVHVDFLKAEK